MKKTGNRVIRCLDAALNVVIFLSSAVALFVSGYSLLDNMQLYRDARDKTLIVYKPNLDVPEEKRITLAGQVAWLCIERSNIDYPVMQGESNYEYLNKDPYGEYKLSGSIFLDCRNDANFTDAYSMIYGHHMEHTTMFGTLDYYTIEGYFNSYNKGWIATANDTYDFEIFAVCWGNAMDQTIFNPVGRTTDEIVAYIEENAVFNTGYKPDHRIVALSTCAGDTDMSRLIVFGMLV